MEELNISLPLEHILTIKVEPKDSASRYGSGLVDVFATPAMISLMEQTCHTSIQNLLPPQYTSVGTEINVKHLKATPIGDTVTCQSRLTSIDVRKFTFEVKVFDSTGLNGEGTHSRVVVDIERFIKKLK